VVRPAVIALALLGTVLPTFAVAGPGVPGVRLPTDGAPPAGLADPRGPPPGAGFVWIDGYWQWTDGRYSWVPARWTSDARGWIFHEPYWSPSTGSPATIHEPPGLPHLVASSPPRPLLVESPGAAPSREAVWIAGFWSWTGQRYAWVAGSWSAPYPGRTWIEGYWKREGRSWNWVPGRWRRS
jgi:hypothetical protein